MTYSQVAEVWMPFTLPRLCILSITAEERKSISALLTRICSKSRKSSVLRLTFTDGIVQFSAMRGRVFLWNFSLGFLLWLILYATNSKPAVFLPIVVNDAIIETIVQTKIVDIVIFVVFVILSPPSIIAANTAEATNITAGATRQS